MAYTFQDIGACNCPSTTCSYTFTVIGCNSLGAPGLTVSVYTASGGTLLASGTTDGSGVAALSWSGSGGSLWVAITGSARFNSYGQTSTLVCGGLQTITLTVATGYFCVAGCALPWAGTLHGTDSVLGTATLTRSGLSWTGTSSYAFPGYVQGATTWCFSRTITLSWLVDAAGAASVSWTCATGGASGPNPICPATTGGGPCTETASTTVTQSITCPPSLLISQSLTYNGTTTQADHSAALYGQMVGSGAALIWSIGSGTTFATRTFTE